MGVVGFSQVGVITGLGHTVLIIRRTRARRMIALPSPTVNRCWGVAWLW